MRTVAAFIRQQLGSIGMEVFMPALNACQQMKATILNDDSLLIENLSFTEKENVFVSLYNGLVSSEVIANGEELHNHNNKAYAANGWVYGDLFDSQKKTTPLLCAHSDLPLEIQTFLDCSLFILLALREDLKITPAAAIPVERNSRAHFWKHQYNSELNHKKESANEL